MTKLIERKDTGFYSTASATIRVYLADMERPIIEVDKTTGYNHVTNKYNYEKRKFLVKELRYEFDMFNTRNPTLRLTEINGCHFLKGNKKLGNRSETLYITNVDKAKRKEITDQIPAGLHDYAEVQLREVLQPALDYMIRVGVVI